MPRVCHANALVKQASDWQRGRAVFEQVSGRRLRAATMTRCCYPDACIRPRPCRRGNGVRQSGTPAHDSLQLWMLYGDRSVQRSLGPECRHSRYRTPYRASPRTGRCGWRTTRGIGSGGGGALGRAGESEKLSTEHGRINLEAARWVSGGVLSQRELLRGGGCRIPSKWSCRPS